MFYRAYSSFHRRAQVVTVAGVRPIVLASFGRAHFLGGEGQQVARVALLRLGATMSVQLERATGTQAGVEASLPASRASGEDGNRLSLRAGQRGGIALFVLLDAKVGEAEFVRVGLCAANGGLNEHYLFFFQCFFS